MRDRPTLVTAGMPRQRPRSSRFRLPAFLLAFIVLIAVGVVTVLGVRRLEASTQRVEHTYQVLTTIERARSNLRAAETNARGYRLSGNSALRQAYLEAMPEVEESLATLAQVTTSDPRQHRRAVDFQAVTQGQLQELERLLRIQEVDGLAAAQAAMRIEGSVARARQANRIAEDMRSHELELLAQRQAESAGRASMLLAFVVFGITLSLVLVASLVRGLARENRRSRELERDARVAIARLEEANLLGERLSEQRRTLTEYSGLLQSCHTCDEAMALTSQTLGHLMPDAGGRCYLARQAGEGHDTAIRFGHDAISSSDSLRTEDCWALRRGQPHHNDGRPASMRCAHLDPSMPLADVATYCVPLAAQGASLGLLHVNMAVNAGSRQDDIPLVESVAEQLAMALANMQLRDSLRAQSLRDPLTGLFNRRHLEASLAHELPRCAQGGLPLSLLMIDVDHFKQFNDRHGHAAGDAVLAHVGRILQSLVREQDLACRYGGEEFTVVLPEAGAAVARERAEAIRAAVAGSTLEHLRKPLGPVTVSIGIATFPTDGTMPPALFAAADGALYEAKAAGRNRVVASATGG